MYFKAAILIPLALVLFWSCGEGEYLVDIENDVYDQLDEDFIPVLEHIQGKVFVDKIELGYNARIEYGAEIWLLEITDASAKDCEGREFSLELAENGDLKITAADGAETEAVNEFVYRGALDLAGVTTWIYSDAEKEKDYILSLVIGDNADLSFNEYCEL